MKTELTEWFGYCLAYGTFLLFAATFLLAYFSPAKAVTIHINRMGEANIEFAILAVILFFMTLGLVSFTARASSVNKY